jgi:hypothetical protein
MFGSRRLNGWDVAMRRLGLVWHERNTLLKSPDEERAAAGQADGEGVASRLVSTVLNIRTRESMFEHGAETLQRLRSERFQRYVALLPPPRGRSTGGVVRCRRRGISREAEAPGDRVPGNLARGSLP